MRLQLPFLLLLGSFLSCSGQKPFGTEYLRLKKEILLPGVKGRIDHMAFNLADQVLYVAALGNHSIEVVDVKAGKHLKSIRGFNEPQGLAFLPETAEVVVANAGNGDCVFLNASTFEKTATVHLAGDADNIRYNALSGKIYVGFGEGGIAEIDVKTHKLLREAKLNAHPEGFQLDQKNNRLFVNLPDAGSIAVMRLPELTRADTWKIKNERANFPMTLDTANNRVFVGYRHPAVLVGYDAITGKELARSDLVGDVDDVFFYQPATAVLASGGAGYIHLFKAEGGSGYRQIANIPTREGARTALLVSPLQTFLVAERATGGKAAAVAVYKINL